MAKLIADKKRIENELRKRHDETHETLLKNILAILNSKAKSTDKNVAEDVKKSIAEINALSVATKKTNHNDKSMRNDGWTTNVRNLRNIFPLSDEFKPNTLPHVIFSDNNFLIHSDNARYVPNSEAKKYKWIFTSPDLA